MQKTHWMESAWTRGRILANGMLTGNAQKRRVTMSKDRSSKIVTPFDKRIVHRNGKAADGYDEHIAALKCAKCGSKEACACTRRKK